MVSNQSVTRVKFALGLTTFATILLELCMVRTFDVILNPLMGYMVITASMFAMGLGGIYVYLLKSPREKLLRQVPKLSLFYAVMSLALLPLLNFLPFDMNFSGTLIVQVLSWSAMYLVLIIPFFTAGIIISILFSCYSSESHALYFYDLLGAGLGCLILIPLIPYFGPGGLLFLIAAFILFGGFLFSTMAISRLAWVAPLLIILFCIPLIKSDYFEFRGHGNKRGVDEWIKQGKRDYIRWDSVSKLGVFNVHPTAKYFALDGGQQASWLGAFDGNYKPYLQEIQEKPDSYYYGLNSVSHYFKRGTSADVLILGAAVGGETKAALIFGARHVDAIELVEAMVRAAKTRYGQFSGNVFNHPKVNYQVGEGRTFLRSTAKKYDIIQMFSNHTSSSIAQGSGALGAAYLQTAEAYIEYFDHLKDDGLLSINRHIYPRMLTTAAQAWDKMGRRDFARHALVLERWRPDTLPTLLIKMSPWTKEEVETIYAYMNREKVNRSIWPESSRPSPKVYKDNSLEVSFTALVPEFSGVSFYVGTYARKHLSYPIAVSLYDNEGIKLREARIEGNTVRDNTPVEFSFDTVSASQGKQYRLVVSSDNPDEKKGFSVWMTLYGKPVLQTIPAGKLPIYNIVFNPHDLEHNLIPVQFLEQPFPYAQARQAEYRLAPVTDDKPHFNMIRKAVKFLEPGKSKYLDGSTAQVLNSQLLPFLSSDFISFFVVGVVSIIFAVIFIFVPLLGSSLGRARWDGRRWFLLYFSCLGAGFIIIELTFIQIFTKLIGFPTHTFATVLFSLLFSAGIGSVVSKRLGLNKESRWKIIFIGIFTIGSAFILSYQQFFSYFLEFNLSIRILASIALIFPLGFFMGMPFPLGMFKLGSVEAGGIPWAWGMNGFFTVFGGFSGMIIAFFIGFKIVLAVALFIYLIACFSYARIVKPVT